MTQQPQLGNDFGDESAAVEHSHDRALRDNDGYHGEALGDRGGGEMTAAETQRDVDVLHRGLEIPARGADDAIFRHDERLVELGELLQRAAQVGI